MVLLLSDICKLLDEMNCFCSFGPRCVNEAALRLPRFGFVSETSANWLDVLPNWLSSTVRLDSS